MNRILYILLVLVLISFVGCKSGGSLKTLEGNAISITYNPLDSLTDEDYIIIDGLKVQHKKEGTFWLNQSAFPPDDESDNSYVQITYVPTSITYRKSAAHGDREFMERWDTFNLANFVGRRLKKFGYEVKDGRKLSLLGELIIVKSDSTKITIQVPPNYPAQIAVTE